jgi:hypothetical protein
MRQFSVFSSQLLAFIKKRALQRPQGYFVRARLAGTYAGSKLQPRRHAHFCVAHRQPGFSPEESASSRLSASRPELKTEN